MKYSEFLKVVKVKSQEEKDIEAVEQNGYAIEYVKEQTEAICMAAVKQNGNALYNVKEQTEAICIAAVKQNGYALQYVNKEIFDK
jgi:hypothetical protein